MNKAKNAKIDQIVEALTEVETAEIKLLQALEGVTREDLQYGLGVAVRAKLRKKRKPEVEKIHGEKTPLTGLVESVLLRNPELCEFTVRDLFDLLSSRKKAEVSEPRFLAGAIRSLKDKSVIAPVREGVWTVNREALSN